MWFRYIIANKKQVQGRLLPLLFLFLTALIMLCVSYEPVSFSMKYFLVLITSRWHFIW